MITPDPAFRPNPNRAVYLHGEIRQELVDSLTPQIIQLKHQSFDPLTIYIDSVGGNPFLAESISKLLFAGNQDRIPRCQIITVVTRQAASAAADLLSSGDYALAYPGASLLYHGVRLSDSMRPLTHEWTSALTDYLREQNKTYAMQLGEKIIGRFMFRFVFSKGRFDQLRKDYGRPDMSELDCFLAYVREKLSAEGRRVLDKARARYQRYDELLDWVMRYEKTRKQPATKAARDALMLKAIVDYEVRNNRGNDQWSFEDGGMTTLNDDFFLLKEYIWNYQVGNFKSICMTYGDFLMSPQEKEELRNVSEAERNAKKAEKVEPLLFPIWSFFGSICNALQYGENQLTAHDAYWLGLIDELIGDEELPSLRLVQEYSPDADPLEPTNRGDTEEPMKLVGTENG